MKAAWFQLLCDHDSDIRHARLVTRRNGSPGSRFCILPPAFALLFQNYG